MRNEKRYELICAYDECDFRLVGDWSIVDDESVETHPHPTRMRELEEDDEQ